MYLPQNVNNDRYFLCKLFITDFEWEDDNNKIGEVKGGLCALSFVLGIHFINTLGMSMIVEK